MHPNPLSDPMMLMPDRDASQEMGPFFLFAAQFPVLLISSTAGLGNYSVAKALQERLKGAGAVFHRGIETLIPEGDVQADFLRHRFICTYLPALFYILYYLPVSYWLKYRKGQKKQMAEFFPLLNTINTLKVRTVIATSNRAAFWVSLLKQRGLCSVNLVACVTDYCVHAGWKFIAWDQVDGCVGPVPFQGLPFPVKKRYEKMDIPVSQEYQEIAGTPGSKTQVLLTGGGWGLGDLCGIAKKLIRKFPELLVHIPCGDNQRLLLRLQKELPRERVFVYPTVDSLAPIMKKCAAVISKPGAVTLTEAHMARRKIFLIRGLPVCEEKNAKYAIAYFGAEPFNLGVFERWYQGAP